MKTLTLQNWIEPIDLLSELTATEYIAFVNTDSSTYIGIFHKHLVLSKSFSDFFTNNDQIFGFVGYEFPKNTENTIFYSFHLVINFDHNNKQIILQADDEVYFTKFESLRKQYTPKPQQLKYLQPNFTRDEYIQKVKQIQELILNGEVYQANLTNKFIGEFESVDYFKIFKDLYNLSKAKYASFMRFGDLVFISSSPELFFSVDENYIAKTRPIKGTIPINKGVDFLPSCPKNKAENLMITDLMRNDFNKVCKTASVITPSLFAVTEHNNLYHMHSEVRGKVNENEVHLLLESCFPPGSMTGAPKTAAINVLQQLEQKPRNVYSGCYGTIMPNNTLDLFVTIRTIVFCGNSFEFQVGGGITYDSTPDEEYDEMLLKADNIIKTISIACE